MPSDVCTLVLSRKTKRLCSFLTECNILLYSLYVFTNEGKLNGRDVNSVKDDMGFDLAGSALGIVNPSKVITGDKIKGDVLIGISSSGIHSNGLTLDLS